MTRDLGRILLLMVATATELGAGGGWQDLPSTWLDRPLASWNEVVDAVPRAPASSSSGADILERCQLPTLRTTSGEQALAEAGWIPFHYLDRPLVRDDVETVGGMLDADAMCGPMRYNLFVFVGGRFAGTLSPSPMDSRVDASSATVRLLAEGTITADFARFAPGDATCCPSSRVTVVYRIDRAGARPVVVPAELRKR
jgi:hypothetical protein